MPAEYIYETSNIEAETKEDERFKEHIHSICIALGGFEKVSVFPQVSFLPNPARRDRNLCYVPGVECFECIKDIRKLLRQEETSLTQPVRLLLAEWNTFQEDLLPILAIHPNFFQDRVGRACCKFFKVISCFCEKIYLVELIVYLMSPVINRPFSNNIVKEIIEEEELYNAAFSSNSKENRGDKPSTDIAESEEELSDNDYDSITESIQGVEVDEKTNIQLSACVAIKEHRHHQLRYKEAVLQNGWIFDQVISQTVLLLEKAVWDDEDERFLFTAFTFIKSLLDLETPQENRTFSAVTLSDKLVLQLQSSLLLDFLLSVMGSIDDHRFQPYSVLLVDIVFCIFRYVDWEILFESLQQDGTILEKVVSQSQEYSLKDRLKATEAHTLIDVLSIPTRHSRFGGTNTINMPGSTTPKFFSPKQTRPQKQSISEIDFSKLSLKSAEELLSILKLKKSDILNKRPRLRVDTDHRRLVIDIPTKRCLLDFAYQFTNSSSKMFAATQRKAFSATTDERGRESMVLNLALNTAIVYMKTCQDFNPVRSLVPLLASNSLSHYLMDTINEFKGAKCIKALTTALATFQSWLELMLCLNLMPDDSSVSQQLRDIGRHQLHNFVHDYAMLRPLHDLFTTPSYHPTLIPALIPSTFRLNEAVKSVIVLRSGALFARRKTTKKRIKDQGPSKIPRIESDLSASIIIPPDENSEVPGYSDEGDDEPFDDHVLDYNKYLRTYASDGIIKGHLIYLNSITDQIESPAALALQPFRHLALNHKLQMATTLIHHVVVKLGCIKTFYNAAHLHSLRKSAQVCRNIQTFYVHNKGLALPDSLSWVAILEQLDSYIFHSILKSLRNDPFMLKALLPKSASKVIHQTLANSVTPHPDAIKTDPTQLADSTNLSLIGENQDEFDDAFWEDLYA